MIREIMRRCQIQVVEIQKSINLESSLSAPSQFYIICRKSGSWKQVQNSLTKVPFDNEDYEIACRLTNGINNLVSDYTVYLAKKQQCQNFKNLLQQTDESQKESINKKINNYYTEISKLDSNINQLSRSILLEARNVINESTCLPLKEVCNSIIKKQLIKL